MTTTALLATPAELIATVTPGVAAKHGRGRGHLLAAYGQGLTTLPEQTLDVLRSLARAELARRELLADDADPGSAHAAYSLAVLQALRSGRDLPTPEVVEDIERRARLHGIRQTAVAQARQTLADQLESSMADGDAIVAGHVRPAVAALYDEARGLLAKHGQHLVAPAEQIVGEPASVAKAWQRFGVVAADVATLRAIQSGLTVDTAGRDSEGAFLIVRDDPRSPKLWGASYGGRHRTRERPWPTDPRGYLGWLLTTGLEVWVPTGPERDARWAEVFDKRPDVLSMLGGKGEDLELVRHA